LALDSQVWMTIAPLAPGLMQAGGGTVDNPAAQTLQTREPDAEA
jgi:hypothetical protein